MQRPARPFESLEWYREASRRDARPRGVVNQTVQWLRSSRFLAFHIGVFALGITIALAINVARSPGSLWVDRLALSWVLLLIVHAAVIVLLFAINLLGTSEQRLPVYAPQNGPPVPQPTEQASAGYAWPAAPPRSAESDDSAATSNDVSPSSTSAGDAVPAQAATTVRPRTVPGGWPGSGSSPSDATDVASWREVSPSAWIRRNRTDTEEPSTPKTTPAPQRESDGG